MFLAVNVSVVVSGSLYGMAMHWPIEDFFYSTSLSWSIPETQTHPIFLVFLFFYVNPLKKLAFTR